MRILQTFTVEGYKATMRELDDGSCEIDHADFDINADGCPMAYHPNNTGLDDLRNAKDANGKYVGILTNSKGQPLIQAADDPAPGYYISTTAYVFKSFPPSVQRHYLDGNKIPFMTLPFAAFTKVKGIVMGCYGEATNLVTGQTFKCMVGDRGPKYKVGEGSPALARLLNINDNARHGGVDQPIIRYRWWPGRQYQGFSLQPLQK